VHDLERVKTQLVEIDQAYVGALAGQEPPAVVKAE
jgi:hypothetical protein